MNNKNDLGYCYNCNKGNPVSYEVKEEYVNIVTRQKKVRVKLKVPYCRNCGKEVYVPSISEENVEKIKEAK